MKEQPTVTKRGRGRTAKKPLPVPHLGVSRVEDDEDNLDDEDDMDNMSGDTRYCQWSTFRVYYSTK